MGSDKTGMTGMSIALMAGAAMMFGLLGNKKFKDKNAFHKHIDEKGITEPRQVWDACLAYHSKLRKDLAEANAKVKAVEEIARVADGLRQVREMLDASKDLPTDIKLDQFFGKEIDPERLEKAYKEIERTQPDAMVKKAIVAHWWTELLQLFVCWGVIVPDEVELHKAPPFRLVDDKESIEAVLRAEVYKYKSQAEAWKKSYDAARESQKRMSKDMAELRRQVRDLQGSQGSVAQDGAEGALGTTERASSDAESWLDAMWNEGGEDENSDD